MDGCGLEDREIHSQSPKLFLFVLLIDVYCVENAWQKKNKKKKNEPKQIILEKFSPNMKISSTDLSQDQNSEKLILKRYFDHTVIKSGSKFDRFF